MLSKHCMPGTNVLMIGSGSGGDVYGATLAGCNVVAVERDLEQFTAIQRVLINRAQVEQDEMDKQHLGASSPEPKDKTRVSRKADEQTTDEEEKQPTTTVDECHNTCWVCKMHPKSTSGV
jgi:hypothetical protein